MPEAINVRRNPEAGRYEVETDGKLSFAEYILEGDRIVMTHTFVPEELRGRKIAEKLVRAALEDARSQGRKVVPRCTYVGAFILRHPEFFPLVAH